MKRVLLLIAFFVGLIPNLKEMNLECVNSVVGQSMYGEEGGGSCEDLVEQNCDNCGGCICEDYGYKTMDDNIHSPNSMSS